MTARGEPEHRQLRVWASPERVTGLNKLQFFIYKMDTQLLTAGTREGEHTHSLPLVVSENRHRNHVWKELATMPDTKWALQNTVFCPYRCAGKQMLLNPVHGSKQLSVTFSRSYIQAG